MNAFPQRRYLGTLSVSSRVDIILTTLDRSHGHSASMLSAHWVGPHQGEHQESGKIYHVPGWGAYEKTLIDESKGDRWFCTEEEARDA